MRIWLDAVRIADSPTSSSLDTPHDHARPSAQGCLSWASLGALPGLPLPRASHQSDSRLS